MVLPVGLKKNGEVIGIWMDPLRTLHSYSLYSRDVDKNSESNSEVSESEGYRVLLLCKVASDLENV